MIWRAAALCAVCAFVAAGTADAQVSSGQPPTRPPGKPDTLAPKVVKPAPGQIVPKAAVPTPDVARRDTTKGDSVLKWSAPDSVMTELLQRKGYTITRYEGEAVTFDALSKAFAIAASAGRRAQVDRDGQHVVTDSLLIYNDRTRTVKVSAKVNGSYEIVPGGGQAPIAGSATADYSLSERSGKITNARITVQEAGGDRWFIRSEIGKTALGDSTLRIPPRFYGMGGSLTSCDDSIPDYHFELREIKRTEKTLVARPAVLYIRDIPVMWLPFVFQDIRPGRRSGILPPRFGMSDIVRNNPGYRRHIENLGYYWALSDYMDFAGWVNWRSSAGADSLDPGWVEMNGEWKYTWLSRFLSGRLASKYMRQRNGQSQIAVSWGHQERFGRYRSLNTNVNYTSSTQLQRRNTFNPAQAIATIQSSFNYADKIGPASLQLGGTRTQYPGRNQITQTLPTLSLTTGPVSLAPWFIWTPGFRFEESSILHIDQPGTFTTRFVPGTQGRLVDTVAIKRNRYARTVSFDSPLRIFGMDFSNGVTIRDQLLDYPEAKDFYPDADSAQKQLRIFRSTYRTDVDWNPSFSLPPFFQNRFKLSPSVTLGNVDPNPFWIRTEMSGGKFVHQAKRLSYGLSASPTIFGIWPGFGPFQRFRHSISPTFTYTFAPRGTVSDEYLQALGKFRQGYLGSLPQSSISFGLSQNVEAKVGTPKDSGATEDNGQKLKVLSMQFSSLNYDFERARATGRKLAGLTTENFGTTLRSDLLPGFDLAVDYSLFQGSTQSDTALFKPFLTRIASTVRLSKSENPLVVITRLFGRAVPDQSPSPQVGLGQSPQDMAQTRQMASQPIAGQGARGSQFVVPPAKGWEATFSFSTSRSRPVHGDRVINYDPRVRCQQYLNVSPFLYDSCLAQPIQDDTIPATTGGGPIFVLPTTTSVTSSMNFELTQKWSAAWQTSYDFEQHKFASHVVSLQRDLHDWRAIFAFTHSPNGNFAFNFFIALKPQPDLKFDYARSSVRSR